MTLAAELQRLARWNGWANAIVAAAIHDAGGEPLPAVRAYQHIFETEVTWLRRVDGVENAFTGLWGDASLARAEAWHEEAVQRLRNLSANLDEEALAATFTYANSTGRQFTDRVDQTLLQLLFHSQQYRGECAATLIAAGQPVKDFDYIIWRRLGEPE